MFSYQIVFFLIFFFSVWATPLQAQFYTMANFPMPPDVLSPQPKQWWIGPQLGVNINAHNGGFITDYCNCEFKNGKGNGLTLGVEFGKKPEPWFAYGVRILYSAYQAKFNNFITELSMVLEVDENGNPVGGPIEENVLFERTNEVKLSYLIVNPMVQLYPLGGLYIMAGPGLGFTMKKDATYTKTIVPEGYTFYTAGNPDSPTSFVVEEDSGNIRDTKTMRLDLRIGLGYNVRLGEDVDLAPEIAYDLPLTEISSAFPGWNVNSIHLSAILKIFF